MIELGQLESRWQDFEERKVQVVVVSLEGREDAEKTQAQFPHLRVVADEERGLADAVEVIHLNSGRHLQGDTTAPTTLLIDGGGVVRWTFRPGNVVRRLSPDEVLAAIDREMPGG
jgi:peroxiredoxin